MVRRPRSVAAFTLTLAALLALGARAEAKLSDAVVAAFRGKIIVSRGPVAAGATDKETITKLRAAQLAELPGTPTDDGLTWRFHYAAFPKKLGSLGLKLQFISGEQDRRFAAETAIPIPDPQSAVLQGELAIGESQGLERGKAYVIQLVNDKGELLAKTSAILK
jgi:hypothetical protein